MKTIIYILMLPVTFFVSYFTMIFGWGIEPESHAVIIGGWVTGVLLMAIMNLIQDK